MVERARVQFLALGPKGPLCRSRIMPTRSSIPKDRDCDFTRTDLRMLEQAIGEQWCGSPLPDKDVGKYPSAVALSRLGGAKCGRARAESLSPKSRSAIAMKAAAARWKRRVD